MGPYQRLKIVVSGIGRVPAKASPTLTGITRDCCTARVLAIRAGYRDSPGAARPVIKGRSKKLWMPAGAAQVAGTALTQCAAVATTPGLLFRPASTLSGCQPLTVMNASGLPRTSISYRSPAGPKDQGGSRFSSPINQFTVIRTTTVLPTNASQWKRRPATWPGSISPIGESIGA